MALDGLTVGKSPERVGEMEEANDANTKAPLDHDAAANANIRRKLDRYMMPLFFVLCTW